MNADVAEDVLAEIEGRAGGATAGPWGIDTPMSGRPFEMVVIAIDRDGRKRSGIADAWSSPDNAAFIAHARTDVPRMAEALRAVLAVAADRWTCDTTCASEATAPDAPCDCWRAEIPAAITAALGCEAGK